MPLFATDALVVHVFPYLESSRIVRLVTRERGVVSVLARGARRPKSRFGSALDLFVSGNAQISFRANRDLQTLASFDVARARPSLGEDLRRFTGASAVAELALRAATEDVSSTLFDALSDALDHIAAAGAHEAVEATLAAAWHLVGALGFAPAVEQCASCHATVPADRPAPFACRTGGALCPACGPLERGARVLPIDALATLRAFVSNEPVRQLDDASVRAHQRLLREFIQEHIGDGRELRAYDSWERGGWHLAV